MWPPEMTADEEKSAHPPEAHVAIQTLAVSLAPLLKGELALPLDADAGLTLPRARAAAAGIAIAQVRSVFLPVTGVLLGT